MKGVKNKRKNVDFQENKKIIKINEVRQNGGIITGKKHFFIAYLRCFFTDEEFHKHIDSLTVLATYIAQKELLYVKVRDGYKLMKYSSILTDLCSLSKDCEEKVKQELEKKRKYKEKYYCKKKRL